MVALVVDKEYSVIWFHEGLEASVCWVLSLLRLLGHTLKLSLHFGKMLLREQNEQSRAGSMRHLAC